MGYVKYKEDDIKIYEDRKKFFFDWDKHKKAISVFKHNCYYCEKSFDSQEARNEHIKASHDVFGPLVFVNGKVATGDIYTKSIDQVVVDLCGYYNSKICINRKELVLNVKSDYIDISSHFPLNHIQNINIDDFELSIFIYPNLTITNNLIDTIIENWEKDIQQGQMIYKNYPESLNMAEKHFLNGFYNYYLACISTHDKQKRYEDAYAILSEFDFKTPLSLSVLRVIAFRLNWVEKLGELKGADKTFNKVYDFFNNKETKLDEEEEEEGLEKKFFIENELEELLNLIEKYQDQDYNFVKNNIRNFKYIDDSNQFDKYLLLAARLAICEKSIDLAKSYYQNIKSPFFDNEKNQYLNIGLNLGANK